MNSGDQFRPSGNGASYHYCANCRWHITYHDSAGMCPDADETDIAPRMPAQYSATQQIYTGPIRNMGNMHRPEECSRSSEQQFWQGFAGIGVFLGVAALTILAAVVGNDD